MGYILIVRPIIVWLGPLAPRPLWGPHWREEREGVAVSQLPKPSESGWLFWSEQLLGFLNPLPPAKKQILDRLKECNLFVGAYDS
ncbi:hypothetical protein CRG98_040976 [Punica granatum]|uniref:Uncharacterized protein n=1 Tax=Punica granatum TaxID=22663 RepID=A0A2I0I3V0_PUNGR|nr:hypothetical protein CRG98_040976 [Punica granatum]